MLREISNIRQRTGEYFRRWFQGQQMEVLVWEDMEHNLAGFEMSYRKGLTEYALLWEHPDHFAHYRVDDGEGSFGRHKSSPVLLHDDHFEADYLLMLFELESQMLEHKLANLVRDKILQCPLRGPVKHRHDENGDLDL